MILTSPVCKDLIFRIVNNKIIKAYYPVSKSDDIMSFHVGDDVVIRYFNDTIIRGWIATIYSSGFILRGTDGSRLALTIDKVKDIKQVKE